MEYYDILMTSKYRDYLLYMYFHIHVKIIFNILNNVYFITTLVAIVLICR